MAFDFTNFNEWTSNLSLDKLLSGNLEAFVPILYLIISIAIYSIIIFHFYRFIARRDCFKPSKRKHTKTVGFLRYAFLFPFVAVLFFMGFSLMMMFLTRTYSVKQILSTAFAVVVAIRITAYYHEDLSRDVAKMLPFVILGIFLIDPSYFTPGEVMNRINSLPTFINTIVQYIFFMIIVEWILRAALTARYAIFPKKEVIPAKVEENDR